MMVTPTTQINESLLDNKLAELEKARSWSPRIVSKLETFIRTADDYDLFRINPLQFGKDRAISETEAIDLFLHAAKLGLFEIDWNLVCAYCATIIDSFSQLSSVHSHYRCTSCATEVDAALDDYIQATFTISSQIREIAFHHPEQLPAPDYYFKYHIAKGIRPLPIGMTPIEALQFLTKAVFDLMPHEKKTIELELPGGLFEARDLTQRALLAMVVDSNPDLAHSTKDDSEKLSVQTVPMMIKDGKFQVEGQTLHPLSMQKAGVTHNYDQFGQLTPGKTQLTIENQTDGKRPIWMVLYPPGFEPFLMEFESFLSGKRLLTTQTFRDLFRSEVVQSTEGIAVKDITFLFTDLKSSTELYDRIGDPKAYYLVRQHFDTLGKVIASHSGAVVKTIGDAVMATFSTPLDALEAAVEMIRELDKFNQSINDKLILKIGIHRGHSIAVTLNERIDYFGQTVNIAARVQGLAEASEICITKAISDYPGVADILATCKVEPTEATLKGVSEKIGLHRVIP